MLKTRKNRISTFDMINVSVLLVLAFLCLYPFWYIAVLSFNGGKDTLSGGIYWWPRDFTVSNYLTVFYNGVIIRAYKVTIARTLLGTIGTLLVTGMAAYGVSDRKLPGRKIFMKALLVSLLFSGGLIPSFLTLKFYGLLNTFWIYIIPGLFSTWNCIIMKTFFQGIPDSLRESVRIDGGNELSIFVRIIIPLSKPVFAALALFLAVGHWNDWFTGAYFIRSDNLRPVQTYLISIMNRDMINMQQVNRPSLGLPSAFSDFSQVTSMSLKLAIVMIGTIPILIVYPFLQKYFIKGLLIGSIKE